MVRTEISLFLKNVPGELGRLASMFGEAGINIDALTIQDASAYVQELFKARGKSLKRIASAASYNSMRKDSAEFALIRLLAEDGGYFILGTTDVEFEPEMKGDMYLVRTDAAGEVLWEKTYGGPGADKQVDNRRVAFLCGLHQRGSPVRRRQIGRRACPEQFLDDLGISILRGNNQRRHPIRSLCVGRRPGAQQQLHHRQIARPGRHYQSRHTILACQIDIGAAFDECLQSREVTLLDGLNEGRGRAEHHLAARLHESVADEQAGHDVGLHLVAGKGRERRLDALAQPRQAIQCLEALGNNVLMRRKAVVGQGFPVGEGDDGKRLRAGKKRDLLLQLLGRLHVRRYDQQRPGRGLYGTGDRQRLAVASQPGPQQPFSTARQAGRQRTGIRRCEI